MQPRFAVTQMVGLRFGMERWLQAEAVDVSRGGIRCILDEDVADGTSSVYVQLTLDESDGATNVVEAEAVLIHTQPRADGKVDAGFQFAPLSASSQRTLLAFLETVRTKAG